MPDKQKLLRERLGKLGLSPRREEEIVRELGEHLEDHAAALEARGIASDEAARCAVDDVPDWTELGNEILLAEREETIMKMNYRTRVLWLPALCALTLSNALLAMFQIFGPPPHFYWLSSHMSMRPYFIFYVSCLISQPVAGAVAAYWSRRAGGAVRHQLLAALSPAIFMQGFALLILPLAFIRDRNVAYNIKLTGFLVGTVTWVLLPSIPLLLGAAPFLRRFQPHS
jgi:hypothetical protein